MGQKERQRKRNKMRLGRWEVARSHKASSLAKGQLLKDLKESDIRGS